jgi:putative addiction module component (TIGR02574 family)
MTARSQDLLREALALPPEERADVAAELLASLDEPAPADEAAVQAAWAQEIERRARRALSGESKGEPWDGVRGRIARNLAKR